MVKSVVGDESQLKPFDESLFASGDLPAVQVGLVVGKLRPSSERGVVYALIPTPATDTGDPACFLSGGSRGGGGGGRKKGGKGSVESAPSIGIDGDWVAEHARQVSRMLLGGMDVVGIYLVSSEASFKATTPAAIAQVIRGVAQAAQFYDSTFSERVFFHISYSPRRWACRICDVASATLWPCDFKYGKLLSSLQALRCTYNFKISIPILHAEPIKKVILKAVNYLAKDLQGAKAIIDGSLFLEDKGISSEDIHVVDLLLPFKDDLCSEECSLDGVSGLVVFSGTVCASAYFAARESVSEALSDLKADVISSLRSRLDIIIDDDERKELSDGDADKAGDGPSQNSTCQVIFHGLRDPYHQSFPRRILVPWFGGIYICDYLQPSETFEDTAARCREMMSIDAIEASAILEPETAASPTPAKPFWDFVNQNTNSGNMLNPKPDGLLRAEGTRTLAMNRGILAALVLAIAILVGAMLTVSGVRSS